MEYDVGFLANIDIKYISFVFSYCCIFVWQLPSTVKYLISVRGCRPGKIVQMTEAEVRGLCIKSREIFLSQPILLELEAPLKICGM